MASRSISYVSIDPFWEASGIGASGDAIDGQLLGAIAGGAISILAVVLHVQFVFGRTRILVSLVTRFIPRHSRFTVSR